MVWSTLHVWIAIIQTKTDFSPAGNRGTRPWKEMIDIARLSKLLANWSPFWRWCYKGGIICMRNIIFVFWMEFHWNVSHSNIFILVQLTMNYHSLKWLAPNRWQAITCTNNYQVPLRIYVCQQVQLPGPHRYLCVNRLIEIKINLQRYPLMHCGLVMPIGIIDLGQHWLRSWLVAWQHQAFTWSNH